MYDTKPHLPILLTADCGPFKTNYIYLIHSIPDFTQKTIIYY